eukprot:TRINITY_DN41663_c0_g1_i1.p1 TRINITY_DN41663_c0_g1~~TRINITY_DN41663_c0_g1_i1.p1  ORF type:complete len:477 (+),score=108.01 TRINITY_DN41663_c0_g1_i1:75-1505(+)
MLRCATKLQHTDPWRPLKPSLPAVQEAEESFVAENAVDEAAALRQEARESEGSRLDYTGASYGRSDDLGSVLLNALKLRDEYLAMRESFELLQGEMARLKAQRRVDARMLAENLLTPTRWLQRHQGTLRHCFQCWAEVACGWDGPQRAAKVEEHRVEVGRRRVHRFALARCWKAWVAGRVLSIIPTQALAAFAEDWIAAAANDGSMGRCKRVLPPSAVDAPAAPPPLLPPVMTPAAAASDGDASTSDRGHGDRVASSADAIVLTAEDLGGAAAASSRRTWVDELVIELPTDEPAAAIAPMAPLPQTAAAAVAAVTRPLALPLTPSASPLVAARPLALPAIASAGSSSSSGGRRPLLPVARGLPSVSSASKTAGAVGLSRVGSAGRILGEAVNGGGGDGRSCGGHSRVASDPCVRVARVPPPASARLTAVAVPTLVTAATASASGPSSSAAPRLGICSSAPNLAASAAAMPGITAVA